MKKKILFFWCFFLSISFFIINEVHAEDSLSLSYYEPDKKCVIIDSSSDGGVFYASSVGHYDIINTYFSKEKSSLSITDDTWIQQNSFFLENYLGICYDNPKLKARNFKRK